MTPRDQLIVALDVPSVEQASDLVSKLGDTVSFYKIGHQLAFAGGLGFASELLQDNKRVFLDMKLLDIDNTIAKGIENIVKMGVNMTTIHAYPKAMRAAVEAARGSDLCLLGVTVLTSMDDQDLANAGYAPASKDLVVQRAANAAELGMGGVVASAQEASQIRSIIPPKMSLVTPGIRPQGADVGDQKRVMTPADAISAGASHLVVGRPITSSDDPKAAAATVLEQMQLAEA